MSSVAGNSQVTELEDQFTLFGVTGRSTIVVMNLPQGFVEDQLRELFSQKVQITDVKMRFKSARSAFIGFHTEEEAYKAVQYFDKYSLHTHKLFCKVVRRSGPPLRRPKRLTKKDNEVIAP